MSGWIKLHRSLIDWEWYTDHNTSRLFIHCLVRANFEDKEWRGIPIKRGSFYTSLDTLSRETGLSPRQIRTSFDKLISTGELTSSGMARGRMVTIHEYDSYQEDDRLNGSQVTGKRQADDRLLTANKNLRTKEDKNKDSLRDDEFDQVWDLYGKKGNKKSSKAKYLKLSETIIQDLLNHIPVYVLSTPDKQYRKNFETYLNQEVWNDEVTHETHQQANQPKPSLIDRVKANTEQRARDRAERNACRETMAQDDSHVRAQILQPIRGDTGRHVGELLEGDYRQTDG